MNPLLTESQAAALLVCAKSSMRRLRTSGRVPYFRVGDLIRYRVEDIETLVANHTTDVVVVGLPRRSRARLAPNASKEVQR